MDPCLILNKENFCKFIDDSKLIIVDFFAKWCGPCSSLAPILDKISSSNDRIKVGKIDVDAEFSQNLSVKYKVRSIPTLLFFKNGKLIYTNVGFISENDLNDKIKQYE